MARTIEAPGVAPDDAEQWREVAAWKDRALASTTPVLRPLRDGLSEARSAVAAGLRTLPGMARVDDSVQEVLHQLAAAGAGAGAATVRRDAVFAHYRRHGHDVTSFKDIRRLGVAEVQAVLPRLDLGYTTFAGLQGGVTSFLSSTGASAAAGGSGVAGLGSLPGVAVAVTSLAGDALLTVASCTRAVAHVAAYYGYDVTKRSEQVLALAVLAVGLSGDADAPQAYDEVSALITLREQDKDRKKRQQRQLKRLALAVHQRLLRQIGQREIVQLVPVVGVGVGVVLSGRLLAKVVDAAEHLYRERLLHERYDIPFAEDVDLGEPLLVEEDPDFDEDAVFDDAVFGEAVPDARTPAGAATGPAGVTSGADGRPPN